MLDAKNIEERVKEVREDAEIAGRVAAGVGHAVILAGLGAVGLVRDETSAMMNKMVERGAVAEGDARKRMADLGQRAHRPEVKMPKQVEQGVEAVLARMNIPTKEELTALDERIAALSEKIDSLLAKQAAPKAKKTA